MYLAVIPCHFWMVQFLTMNILPAYIKTQKTYKELPPLIRDDSCEVTFMKKTAPKDSGKIIDFSTARDAKIEEKRRRFERVLFKNLLGAYFLIKDEKLNAVDLIDLSHEGLSFQLPKGSKNTKDFEVGKEMSFRLYFSPEAFIALGVKIVNKRDAIEDGVPYDRYGCTVDHNSVTYPAYKSFVEFLVHFAESARTESEQLKMSYF